jgi:hypothetical protein
MQRSDIFPFPSVKILLLVCCNKVKFLTLLRQVLFALFAVVQTSKTNIL